MNEAKNGRFEAQWNERLEMQNVTWIQLKRELLIEKYSRS